MACFCFGVSGFFPQQRWFGKPSADTVLVHALIRLVIMEVRGADRPGPVWPLVLAACAPASRSFSAGRSEPRTASERERRSRAGKVRTVLTEKQLNILKTCFRSNFLIKWESE